MDKELFELVKPVIEYIHENCDPHTILVINDYRADLYRAECGTAVLRVEDSKY